MWNKLLCACVCIALARAAVVPEALHYIGVGYNIVRGNPDGNFWHTGGDDPGLLSTRKILNLSSAVDVPAEIVYEHHDQCREAHEFVVFHDTQSYQNKLKERVTSSGTNNDALAAVAFTLSAGYKAIEQQTKRDYYVFMDEQTTCTSGQARYKLALSQGNHYGLTDEFAAAVCRLPLSYNSTIYKQFLETWGTHVTDAVETGNVVIKRYSCPSKEYVEHVMSVSPRDVSLGGVFMNHASSLVVDMGAFRFRSHYRDVFCNLTETITLGSAANPEPIGYDMTIISDMLDSSHWQNVADYEKRGLCPHSIEAALTYMRKNLEQAITEYPGLAGAVPPASSPLAIPVTWPKGTYSLAKPKSGCPAGDFTWYEGWRLQDTETQSPDNAWSLNNNIAGKLEVSQLQLEYCTKGESEPTDFDRHWPKGDYCIFKYGECPEGFAEGYVKWDDEDSLNRNDWQGVLPDGSYDQDTLQKFCCRSDGMPTEAIILPTDKPFYLFQYKRDVCQKVANMHVVEEWLRWDDEDFKTPSNSEIGSVHPGMEFWNEPTGASGSEIYYCYYSPQTK
ncbi:uncharacterized protein LOC127860098 isoform X2 [Dreissena polymorpha]|uniref:MACPF domain-containing protein n=2 Tax=Dreissena polymorpha TaxID=45954 RepID=A0A9D3YNB1_DREPO|nr:uncharacterized protein LOC127860098 isoform X2 [Dreissena polymorpha]KAH3701576.1 hypothetical protein DPMN_076564 [Dreissena polymorpha]